MMRRIAVVMDGSEDIGPIEASIVALAGREDAGFHLVSIEDARPGPAEVTPMRLRLTLLLARLADRLIPVTGEDAAEFDAMTAALARFRPHLVLVAGSPSRLRRWLRRDLACRLRRLVGVEVQQIAV